MIKTLCIDSCAFITFIVDDYDYFGSYKRIISDSEHIRPVIGHLPVSLICLDIHCKQNTKPDIDMAVGCIRG